MARSRLFACPFPRAGWFAILALTILILGPSARAYAQTPVSGRVIDATGAPVPRVPLTVVASDGRTMTSVVTDGVGRFTVTGCATCRVAAALPGFRPVSAALADGVVLTLDVAPIADHMVVTATRDAAPGSQLGASVTVLDAAAITRHGGARIGDVLRGVPGVTIVETGGRGTLTSLFLRGGENSYTKVLLDGIPLNEPGGSFNFAGLSTGHVDRLELVRGAQSALFGSDAMAGVLQMFSTRGRDQARPEVTGQLSAGGYGTWVGSGQVSGRAGRLSYSLFAGGDVTSNRVPNNRHEAATVSFTAGLSLDAETELRLVARSEDATVGTPGQTAFGRPDLDATFTKEHRVGGLTLERRGQRVSQRLTYALAVSEQRSTNLQLDTPYTPAFEGRTAPFEFFDFPYDSGSRFRRHYAAWQADLRVPHAGPLPGVELFTVAADWNGERGTLADHLGGTRLSPSRDNLGASLQHQHVGARLTLTTGLRVERNDSFGTVAVPRVSASVVLRSGIGRWGTTRATANYGRGIKEPTLRQSFSLSPFDLGNPDLAAERSRSVDVGLEQRLFADRLRVAAAWFDNRFDNQISTRTVSFSPYMAQYVNVGRTDAQGVEVSVEAAPVDGLRLLVTHTLVDSRIVDAASEFSPILGAGRWALRRPRHSGQALVQFDRGRWSADLSATWTGRRSDSDFSSLSPAFDAAEGYTLWRGQVAWRVSSRVTAFARGENLGDVEYMEPLGYPAWRRTAHAGLRLRF